MAKKCNGVIQFVQYEGMTGNVMARCEKCRCRYEHPAGKKTFSNCIATEKYKDAYIRTGLNKKIEFKNIKVNVS